MTAWLAQFAGAIKRRGASAWRGLYPRSRAGAISGPAMNTGTKPSGDGLTPTDLLALRNALSRDWTRARARQDTRGCHQIERDLREVTAKILDKGSCFDG